MERLITEKSDMCLSQIKEFINRGRIILQPDFQREYVYKDSQASRRYSKYIVRYASWGYIFSRD